MANAPHTDTRQREDTVQLLQWLVFLRVVVSTFILITTLLIQLPATLVSLYLLVSVNVLVNLLVAFFVPRQRSLRFPTQFLIYWDIVFVTMLIFVSGGIESPFSFMYILSLIYAGLLLQTRGAVAASILCVMAYASVMMLQFQHLLPAFVFVPSATIESTVRAREIFFKVLINGIGFFIAAFLSNFIAEQLRRTGAQLAEKQDDLEALRTLNQNIVRSVVIGLVTVDPGHLITFVNPTAERILGLPAGQMTNRSFIELFPALNRAFVPGEEDLSYEGRTRKRWECTWKREDGELLHLGFSVSELRDTGDQTIGWIILFQDLSALKRMEQNIKRADLLATVGKLAAGIAHEIRNPMASISGSIQVLASELDLDRVNRSLMEIVIRETDRLNRLISDFLDFARPAQVNPEIIDLNLLLDETIEMVRHSTPGELEIAFHCDFEPDVFIRADSGQLRQLFLNLLLNAVQAMRRGGRVEVSSRQVAAPEGQGDDGGVQIEIADTGKGMKEEELESIFSPFFTTKEAGTGLGLTVAYRIVENHGGRISVSSESGRGTRFTVVLPSGTGWAQADAVPGRVEVSAG